MLTSGAATLGTHESLRRDRASAIRAIDERHARSLANARTERNGALAEKCALYEAARPKRSRAKQNPSQHRAWPHCKLRQALRVSTIARHAMRVSTIARLRPEWPITRSVGRLVTRKKRDELEQIRATIEPWGDAA